MDWNKTFKRITDALTFKTRHRQFINFILDIDEGNVHKVERVLRKHPHFASEKHWATEHLRANQNPLLQDHGLFNLAVPLEHHTTTTTKLSNCCWKKERILWHLAMSTETKHAWIQLYGMLLVDPKNSRTPLRRCL